MHKVPTDWLSPLAECKNPLQSLKRHRRPPPTGEASPGGRGWLGASVFGVHWEIQMHSKWGKIATSCGPGLTLGAQLYGSEHIRFRNHLV